MFQRKARHPPAVKRKIIAWQNYPLNTEIIISKKETYQLIIPSESLLTVTNSNIVINICWSFLYRGFMANLVFQYLC